MTCSLSAVVNGGILDMAALGLFVRATLKQKDVANQLIISYETQHAFLAHLVWSLPFVRAAINRVFGRILLTQVTGS